MMKISCLNCNRVLHSEHNLGDQKELQCKCNHQIRTNVMEVPVLKIEISEEQNPVCNSCNSVDCNCIQETSDNLMEVPTIKEEIIKEENPVCNICNSVCCNCDHETNTYLAEVPVIKKEISEEENPVCNFCNYMIINLAAKVSCLKCNKIFHAECSRRDQEQCNCNHQISTNLTKIPVRKQDVIFCDLCNYAIHRHISKISCHNCARVFHPVCYEKYQIKLRTTCEHPRIPPDGVYEASGPICNFCNCIIKLRARKFSCSNCNKLFHFKCFKEDLKEVKFNCKHENTSLNDRAKKGIKPKPFCDFCKFLIINKILERTCPDCNKTFHAKCLWKVPKIGCRHQNTCATSVRGEDVLEENMESCDYCGQYVAVKVVCMKCKRIFHRKCFAVGFRKKKSDDCKHFAEPLSEPSCQSNEATLDTQNTALICDVPTTSEEIKHEILEASNL